MRRLMLVVVLCMAFSGCRAVGRWMAPIKPEELPAAAQQMLAEKDKEAATALADTQKALAAKDAEIAKIRTSKPTALWPIYLISTLGLVGGAAIGYFLGKIIAGIILAASGALAIGWMQFLERFAWAFWIPFAIGIVVLIYFIIDWYRGVRAQKATEAIVPAIEAAEPVPGPIKASIQTNAGQWLSLVKAEVTAVKDKLGLTDAATSAPAQPSSDPKKPNGA